MAGEDLPKRLPLVIEPENRSDSTLKDARLVNAYVEKRGSDKGDYHIYKKPGTSVYGTFPAAAGLGVYNWLGDIYAVFGSVLYKNGTSVGTGLDTTGGKYIFNQCAVDRKMQLSNGVGAYNYDPSNGLVAISGPNFPTPPFVKGWSYLDGTTYASDLEGGIHGCDSLNDPTSWTDTTNLIIAQIEPDRARAIGKQLVYVVELKEWSTEFFYDAANPVASPLGPVQGAKVAYGCVSADSLQSVDDVLFWLASNRDASPQVCMLQDVKVKVVSTPAIERLIASADLSAIHSFTYKDGGHRFYILTIPSANLTLAYDSSEDMWAQWTDPAGDYLKIVASTYLMTSGHIVQHATNGKLYSMSPNVYLDDSQAITVDIITPNFDGGTAYLKNCGITWFVGDRTVGSNLQVRFNDEDYQADKWQQPRSVDMSLQYPFLPDCGSFHRRAMWLRHASPTPFRISSVELQLALGTR